MLQTNTFIMKVSPQLTVMDVSKLDISTSKSSSVNILQMFTIPRTFRKIYRELRAHFGQNITNNKELYVNGENHCLPNGNNPINTNSNKVNNKINSNTINTRLTSSNINLSERAMEYTTNFS